MIFVDTNVFMYAVGRAHPLRDEAQRFFLTAQEDGKRLLTSAEVLQELLHAYLPVQRMATLDAAWELVRAVTAEVLPIEHDDVELARALVARHPGLGSRDLLHLAVAQRRGVTALHTFDRGLAAAFAA